MQSPKSIGLNAAVDLPRHRLRPLAWLAITGMMRTSDWWEHKLACLLGTLYAMAHAGGVPLGTLGPLWLQAVAALIPCAAYVCIINDLTDQEEDRWAGKSNGMAGRSTAVGIGALVLCLVSGLLAAWSFQACPVTLCLYLGNWLAFTLYSVPPFRLKGRGGWGVLADACGGQLLPTLWMAWLVWEAAGLEAVSRLAWPLGLWAFALGLRGILSHQLRDCENDRQAGVSTLVVRWGPKAVRRWVAWGIWPVEIAALLGLLLRLQAPFTWVLAAWHLLVEVRRAGVSPRPPARGTPRPEEWVVLAEYYKFHYPVTFSLALAIHEPRALLLIALHFALFRQCSLQFARDAYGFLHWAAHFGYRICLGRRPWAG